MNISAVIIFDDFRGVLLKSDYKRNPNDVYVPGLQSSFLIFNMVLMIKTQITMNFDYGGES